MSHLKYCKTILIIDSDPEIVDLFEDNFKDDFIIFGLNDPRKSFEILAANEISVIVCDYEMPNINGIDLLSQVKDLYPLIKRILISTSLDTFTAVDSTNIAEVNKIIQKPWDRVNFRSSLNSLVDQYNQEKILQKGDDELRPDVAIYRTTDDLLNLLLNIEESDTNEDFSNQFSEAINGIRSLISLSLAFFLKSRDKRTYSILMEYLSDIDLIANQFNQKRLSMYSMLIRSYLYLFTSDIDKARTFCEGAKEYLDWLDPSNIHKDLLNSINFFPLKTSNQWNFRLTMPVQQGIEIQIKSLLNIKIEDLVNISDRLFQRFKHQTSNIILLVIEKNGIPVYKKQRQNANFDVTLIVGFITALSLFLQEVAMGSGNIETIVHDNGIVITNKHKDATYVILAFSNDIRYKVALKKFAEESYSIIEKIPNNKLATQDEEIILNKIFEEIFGELF